MISVVCFVNRDLGCRIVRDLISRDGIQVVAVVSNDPPHADLILDESAIGVPVIRWSEFVLATGSTVFAEKGVSALFRHKIPARVLSTISQGVVNLHPSLLPFGRGSHPATWAIWEQTPFGATAHLMTETLDTGPILAQQQVPFDELVTSHELYVEGLESLWRIYQNDVVPWLAGKSGAFRDQPKGGSSHIQSDLRLLQDLDPCSMTEETRSRWARAIGLS